jgi:hypothetical protein
MSSPMLPRDSPHFAATVFVHAILIDGNMAAAWTMMDESLRRTFAWDWIEANAEHPAIVNMSAVRGTSSPFTIAADLATDGPRHALFERFAPLAIDWFRERWSAVDLNRWGWATDPRPAALDLETLLLVDPDKAIQVQGGPMDGGYACPAVELLVRHDGDVWLIAGIGHGGAAGADGGLTETERPAA